MSLQLVLLVWSCHMLFWEKLPEWGSWFSGFIERLPRSLAYLYQAWHCPYCFGFWAAIAAHAITGHTTFVWPMAEQGSALLLLLAWLSDALVTAVLVMLVSVSYSALSGPAVRGMQLTQEFKQAMKAD
ncbi:hypothetical protein CHH28_17495 [Bacterioplanes sanyensis]|uniref:DUF1360 domain-containing protein n=1 Tax=Bacterioplanes sanyensis TaxID=1249553 RepID=A0A222FNJ0_9GAMM|nr:hypothetical protein [Bacterioplanes sanyensis]ASP40360.1 hypothetical protein CHH28_17495 [Bacterioplanes sanyensis]